MQNRPIVTILVVWVFLLGLIQAVRAVLLFQRRDFLAQFPLSLPLGYAILSAAIWAGLLVAAAFGLWRLSRWAVWLSLLAVTGSQVQAWLDRWWFARSDYTQISNGFALATSLGILLVTWGALGWQRRYFIKTKG